MENAADALKMAGSILLFIIALSVTLNAFGQARETADVILSYKDRETEYIEGDYYYKSTGNDADKVRQVGLETVIPSIYRAYKENYRIEFFENGSPLVLYNTSIEITKEDGSKENVDTDVYYIDLVSSGAKSSGVSFNNDESKIEFINGILYGKYEVNKQIFIDSFILKSKSDNILYDKLKDKTITEKLGVYYQEELGGKEAGDSLQESNKTEKRVITYNIINNQL